MEKHRRKIALTAALAVFLIVLLSIHFTAWSDSCTPGELEYAVRQEMELLENTDPVGRMPELGRLLLCPGALTAVCLVFAVFEAVFCALSEKNAILPDRTPVGLSVRLDA